LGSDNDGRRKKIKENKDIPIIASKSSKNKILRFEFEKRNTKLPIILAIEL
jgi:hypothetical protein